MVGLVTLLSIEVTRIRPVQETITSVICPASSSLLISVNINITIKSKLMLIPIFAIILANNNSKTTVESKKLEYGCRMIVAGFPSFFCFGIRRR